MKVLTVLGHAARDHPAEPRHPACSTVLRPRPRAHRPELRPAAERRVLPRARRARARRASRRASATGFADQIGAHPRPGPTRCSQREQPDRLLILGDTNSGLAAIVAARRGHPGLSHGGRQPLLRRPRARGGQPPRHRPLQHDPDALHRAQQGEPGARGHRARAHLRHRQPDRRGARRTTADRSTRATP